MLVRETTDADVSEIARLRLEADDARVVSAAGILHMRRTRPERARVLELVAEIDGGVVATGAAGLNIATTTEGAAWAFVTVDSRTRRQGIGDALGTKLLEHLRELAATKATSFFRWTDDGERWATARGWSRLSSGPLIAVDPRIVAEPSIPTGYRCVPMARVAPEDVYEADKARRSTSRTRSRSTTSDSTTSSASGTTRTRISNRAPSCSTSTAESSPSRS